MIKIKNLTNADIQFEELIISPGINFIEKSRMKTIIEKNPNHFRRFKTLISKGKLEIDE